MKIERVLTKGLTGPVADSIEWKRIDCLVLGKGDEVIFKQDGVEVPSQWSQNAANILASKYFRRAGVPLGLLDGMETADMPPWLWPRAADSGLPVGGETSARQVFHRMVGCWTYWGWREGLFANPVTASSIATVAEQREEQAKSFYDELYMMLARQVAAPNSPQWFNCGLHWAYGIEGPDTGQWYIDTEHPIEDGQYAPVPVRVLNSYERPQPHACFLTSVTDDLVNDGGIMDLWVREARIFKHGAGSGVNPSRIRAKGEKLSGGGEASGLMSFLEVGDRSAGAIQSGGTTRRAAKLICPDIDHPEIENFIGWKSREEHKAAAMAVGSQVIADHLKRVARDVYDKSTLLDGHVRDALADGVPQSLIDRARTGETDWIVYTANAWEGEAIRTVSGQNANNSPRIPDAFMLAVEQNADWHLTARTDGRVMKTVKAQELWNKLCYSTWASGDPGVIFHDTVNAWNTCAIDGEIRTTNPCFTGDTKVWTATGPQRFDKLAEIGTPIEVLTELSDGKLAYRTMRDPRMTRRSATLIKVTLKARRGRGGRKESITEVKVTPNHEFFLTNGTRRRAEDLQAGDRIESAYRTTANQKGYISVRATNGDRVMEHYLAAEFSHGRRPMWPLEHGHHVDEVKGNNTPGNIDIIPASVHNSEHMIGDRNPMRRWFGSLSTEEQAAHRQKYSKPSELNSNYGNRKMAGRIWINNGEVHRRIYPDEPVPAGWVVGKTAIFRENVKKSWEARRNANHVVVSVKELPETEDVYCGTVDTTGRFFISLGNDHYEGVLVSNCAEFHHLDGSACNLASLRLTAFLKSDGSLDLNLFEHACRLWTMVLDISTEMASFPSREFAIGAYNYRTLGLGHADGGGMLMRLALPYDSDEGRALIAGLTALMTGVAYRTSAEMASEIGPFPRWEANAEPFRSVMQKHYDAIPLPSQRVDWPEIWKRAKESWETVLQQKSFRNAQTTLIAPTGTISFVMDCDTFGVEPDYALVKNKQLSGGGTMRIVNQAVPEALRRIGAGGDNIKDGIKWIEEHGTIRDWPGWQLKGNHEGQSVFDCVAELRPMAHVLMVAAIQPFLSGAASKTANLPNDATVEDVRELYEACHRLGVKAIAPFRDGSKMTQPLAAAKRGPDAGDFSDTFAASSVTEITREVGYNEVPVVQLGAGHTSLLGRGSREYLPWRRENGYSQKAKIGDNGQTLHWRVSNFPDGRPGELFIVVSHEGSTLRAMAECVAIAFSTALQHGVSLDVLVDKFVGTKFEPAGIVEGHDRIKFASSIADLIARDLAITYLGREDLAEVALARVVDDPERVVALDRRAIAAASPSYVPQVTGDTCPGCGGLLVRIGPCRYCQNCTYNTGCGG